MAEARSEILAALGPAEGGSLPPLWPSRPGEATVEAFERSFRALGGEVADARLLAAFEGRKWCVEPRLGGLPHDWGPYEAAGPWEADLGVTACSAAIAETGTFVLSGGPGSLRLASLCPPAHLVVVRRAQVVATLAEGLRHLGARNAVLVTGPSRSADIEGVLVRGVHGPGRVLLAWV